MIQRFPELQRIDQGLAASVISIQFVQPLAGDQKQSDRLALSVTLCVISKPDPAQLCTPAQKERSSEDVRRLKTDGFQ